MCLIAVAVDRHPRWRFVLAGNRDEFHARPTAPAGPLDEAGTRFGGVDLVAGGGWLQVDARGRVAAVTNVRLGRPESAPRSRGDLVRGFVEGPDPAGAYLDALAPQASAYGRFNLLLWDGTLHVAGNHPAPHGRALPTPALHALSNAQLDAPWPKAEALRARFEAWLATAPAADPREDETLLTPLFAALADPARAPDEALPSTGVPLDWERRLSAAFIVGEDYGTRASTVLLVGDDGLWFEERRFAPGGIPAGRSAAWLPRRRGD